MNREEVYSMKDLGTKMSNLFHEIDEDTEQILKLNELKVNIEIFSFSKEYSSETNIMWCTSNKMYHKISTMEKSQYNGIIQIAAFNCGCDSMMIETFRPVINEKKIPYMVLIIDEHSAQAGLDTRLEAFIDSTGW